MGMVVDESAAETLDEIRRNVAEDNSYYMPGGPRVEADSEDLWTEIGLPADLALDSVHKFGHSFLGKKLLVELMD